MIPDADDFRYGDTLYDVAWHPTQHMVALASFGGAYPIQVLVGEDEGHKIAGAEAGGDDDGGDLGDTDILEQMLLNRTGGLGTAADGALGGLRGLGAGTDTELYRSSQLLRSSGGGGVAKGMGLADSPRSAALGIRSSSGGGGGVDSAASMDPMLRHRLDALQKDQRSASRRSEMEQARMARLHESMDGGVPGIGSGAAGAADDPASKEDRAAQVRAAVTDGPYLAPATAAAWRLVSAVRLASTDICSFSSRPKCITIVCCARLCARLLSLLAPPARSCRWRRSLRAPEPRTPAAQAPARASAPAWPRPCGRRGPVERGTRPTSPGRRRRSLTEP